jgi:hypothetical protein
MPGALERVLVAPLIFAAVALFLWWGALPAQWRRTLALASSAAGLALLMVALNTEGYREAPTLTQFMLSGRYVTGYSSASASLPYYVLTAVCLLLGTFGLVTPDTVAGKLEKHWLASAVLLSLGVTALRFSLEKVAAPASWSHAVGITWMPPVVGAWFAHRAWAEGRPFRAVLRALVAYAFAVRLAVVGLMVLASRKRWGSHYDLSGWTRVRSPFADEVITFAPGSLDQIVYLGVFPQLTFNVCITIAVGLLGAGAYRMARRAWEARHPVAALRAPIEWEPASQDR